MAEPSEAIPTASSDTFLREGIDVLWKEFIELRPGL
jgi:hypothetical protein